MGLNLLRHQNRVQRYAAMLAIQLHNLIDVWYNLPILTKGVVLIAIFVVHFGNRKFSSAYLFLYFVTIYNYENRNYAQ